MKESSRKFINFLEDFPNGVKYVQGFNRRIHMITGEQY